METLVDRYEEVYRASFSAEVPETISRHAERVPMLSDVQICRLPLR